MADLGAIGQLTVPDDLATVLGPSASGITRDKTGAVGSYTVRVSKRSDGSVYRTVVSNAAGFYSVPFPPTGWGGVECHAICLYDDVGGLENDRVHRFIPE